MILDINFKDMDFKKVCSDKGKPYGIIMFRILDEKKIIMGDARNDNMILFVKFINEEDEVL